MVLMVSYTQVENKLYAKLETFVSDKELLTKIAKKLTEATNTERVKFSKHLPRNFPTSTILLELSEEA